MPYVKYLYISILIKKMNLMKYSSTYKFDKILKIQGVNANVDKFLKCYISFIID